MRIRAPHKNQPDRSVLSLESITEIKPQIIAYIKETETKKIPELGL